MRIALFTGLLVLGVALFAPLTAPVGAANCAFVLGFSALHDLIPNQVGSCLVDEHHGANGDALQETTGPTGAGGLLVWRKADNWTAFTDGYHTWVNGPNGLQERLNTQCYAWEAGCSQPIGGTALDLSAFQSFVQSWTHHGFNLTVHPDGTGDGTWRMYAWCSASPPPCDQMVGNTVVDGGSAHLVFNQVNGQTVVARVTMSTDDTTLITGSTVTLTLLPYDQAQLNSGVPNTSPTSLCGPQFGDLAPSDLLASSPCGA